MLNDACCNAGPNIDAQLQASSEPYGSPKRTLAAIGAVVMRALQVRGAGSGPWDLLDASDDGGSSYFAQEQESAPEPIPQDVPEHEVPQSEERGSSNTGYLTELLGSGYLASLVERIELAERDKVDEIAPSAAQLVNNNDMDMLTSASEAAEAAKAAFDRARQQAIVPLPCVRQLRE